MSSIALNTMSLSDLAPFVLGKETIGDHKEPVRCDQSVLEKFLTRLEEDTVSKSFFETYNSSKDFFITAVDLAHEIPKNLHTEVFYAAKNGKLFYEIPSQCAYILRKAYEACEGIPNLILKIVPFAAMKEWFAPGYFMNGVTLYDAIANVCDPNYYPLSKTHLKNKVNNYTEVYVESTDMVAAIPNSIADRLDDDSIRKIVDDRGTLMIDDRPIRTMGEYFGAIDSTYDLRQLI